MYLFQAAIVGYHTRKVLFFGVKNKYCVTCARIGKNGGLKKDHTCFKNWTGSSSSMEAATIVEGFLSSEEMYGVRYTKMIADGDSSVYHNILQARPYDNLTVQKIECRNHLMRNYCNKIREIVTTSSRASVPDIDKASHIKLRRIIGSRLLRCRAAVTKAIEYRKKEDVINTIKIAALRKDILNGPSHVFGEHRHCEELGYFCKGPKDGEPNYIPDMIKTGLYPRIMEAVNGLADFSNHLILNVDSNVVEHYNSAIARFTGGKRVNYTQKGSYRGRCAAAVVSYNTGRAFHTLHKSLLKESPGAYSKSYENRAKRKVDQAALRQQRKPKARRSLPISATGDKDYGPSAQKPDMDTITYEIKVNSFLKTLNKTEQERQQVEEATRSQNQSEAWFEERRIRLTASNFGAVCNRKPYTSCAALVQKILYSSVDCESMKYGRANETTALINLSKELGIEIKPCGLFIDSDKPFLAASPDGLIGEDGIVEIKCPAAGCDLTPDEVISQKKGLVGTMWQFCQKTNTLKIKEKHAYHLQVQGQLHITQRQYCLFTLWTPRGLKYERIYRDDLLWKREMEGKLELFYKTCLLPEIIDPRRRRSMSIREPAHILKSQEERKTKSSVLAVRLGDVN